MTKNKKGRRHRTVNRTPRPVGPAQASRREQPCIVPQQPFRLVHRKQPQNIGGRLYMATARLRIEGEVMEFDLLASLHGIATGEVTGECAAILAAAAFQYIQQAPIPIPVPGCDLTTSPEAMVDSIRRFVDADLMGRDEHGGYFYLDRWRAIEGQAAEKTCARRQPAARVSELMSTFEPDGPVFYNKARDGGLGHHAARTWDELKAYGSTGATVEDLSTSVGYTLPTIRKHLHGLARCGMVEETGSRWRATAKGQWEAAREHNLPVRSSV